MLRDFEKQHGISKTISVWVVDKTDGTTMVHKLEEILNQNGYKLEMPKFINEARVPESYRFGFNLALCPGHPNKACLYIGNAN